MKYYIGKKEIKTVTSIKDKKTPMGGEMVKVIFTDKTSEIMPNKRLELLSSEKEYDLTEMQKKLNKTVGSTMFSLLHEYGVKIGETGMIVDAVIGLVNDTHHKAKEILIGYENDLTPLCVINDILIKNNDDKTS